jgi:hypothetical protein
MANPRSQYTINRQSDNDFSEDHWLKQFEKSLQKGAVQPRKQQSLFDQINSIMNTNSKYNSVEAVVDDMKERSGLTAYLKKAKVESDSPKLETIKNASKTSDKSSDKKDKMPVVIKKFPSILDTLKNCINDSKGNLSIPAIIERVHSIHHNDVSDSKDWDDDDLMYLVSQLNLEAKSNNPTNYEDSTNLGKHDSNSNQEIDPSNTDAFFALNPARF